MTAADRLRIKWEAWADRLWHRAPQLVLGLGALGMLIVAAVWLWPHPTPLPPAEQTSKDSLAATKPDFTTRVETTYVRETTYVAISRQNRVGAAETQRRADSLRAVAIASDSAARAQRDTSSLWERSANIWHATADTLGAANVRLGIAYSAESTARVAADSRADAYARRNVALEDFSGRLVKDLAKADPPCRVLWLKCPSRKVAFVGGALVPPALYLAARSLRP